MTWDMEKLRKIAGLNESAKPAAVKPLTESWDDDGYGDDEDPDVKIAGGDKRQSEYETKNKRALSAAEKEAKEKAAKAKAAKESEKKDDKPAEKSEDKPAEKAEDKAEEKAAEAKRRGKAPNPGSKAQRALAKLKTMTRGEFIRWAGEELEMGKNYASAYYARHNPKSSRELKEANTLFGIVHPFMAGYMLAENREMNSMMQWVDEHSAIEPLVFATEAEAARVVKYIAEWRGQSGTVESFDMSKVDSEE